VAFIQYTDPDFRLFRLPFEGLVDLQRRAESLQWGTRWTSEDALRAQLRAEKVLLMTFMREERAGNLRAIRCLVPAALAENSAGCLVTIDVEPDRLVTIGDVVADSRGSLRAVSRLSTRSERDTTRPQTVRMSARLST
jgi:hypothetical protein